MESLKKSPIGLLLLVLLLLGLAIALGLFLWKSSRKGQNKSTVQKQSKLIKDNSERMGDASEQKVILSFISQEIPSMNPLIILAIALHETGNLTSSVYHNNNNLFGMRMPKERQTTAIGDTNRDGYANYSNVQDSIADFRLWFDNIGEELDFDSPEEIVTVMKQYNYFEASLAGYKKAVRSFFNQLNS